MPISKEARLKKQLALLNDSIVVYVLISTRGKNWKVNLERIKKERTKQMLSEGYTPVPGADMAFYPPKQS